MLGFAGVERGIGKTFAGASIFNLKVLFAAKR
jgi:hypothetical protein